MEPLGPPPPGGDQDRGSALRSVSLVTMILILISLFMRLATRRFIVHQLGLDDLLIFIATVLSVVSTGFNLQQVAIGGGRHEFYLTPPTIIQVVKWSDLSEFLLIWVTALTKISICIFVMRIPNSKRLTKLLYALIALLVVVNGACVIAFLAQCRPMEALWDPAVGGSCWTLEVFVVFGYLQGATSVLTDLICSALPILVLWKIQISTRTKVAVCTLMALGLIASACSIVRIVLLDIVEDPVDITWNIIPVQIWALFEMNLSILAANMPVFLPLYRFLHQKVPEGVSHLRTYLRKSSSYSANDKVPTSDQATLRASESFARLDHANIRKTVDYAVDYDRNSSKHGDGSTELQQSELWV